MIKTRFAGINFENPFFNASGPHCTTKEELDILGQSKAAAVMTKSCTLEPREGNPSPRYVDITNNSSINSMGLPNLGYKEYMKLIPELTVHNKPIFSSVSGMKIEDNIQMISELSDVKELDAIELNLSCPNVVGKPQVGYDFQQSVEVIQEVQKICKKPLGLKLPPYFDFVHFETMAKIINQSRVNFVTCINSLGNGLVIDIAKEQVVIKPKGGFGGMGGKLVKPFGLSNVRKFRELLKPEIQVIGCGGIFSGIDAFEYILAGADMIQVGTILKQEGPTAFQRLTDELKIVMQAKGYNSLDEFRNKLKEIE